MKRHKISKRRKKATIKENEVFNNLLKGMDSTVVTSFTPKQLKISAASDRVLEQV
ncbi:MAG: hypothetical protein JKX76_13030 [Colwellia sp.]|nr:hypothetical protein [Colwellia sp.]